MDRLEGEIVELRNRNEELLQAIESNGFNLVVEVGDESVSIPHSWNGH